MRKDGKRLDVSVAPDYTYLNAYGKYSDSPHGGTDGRMYRLVEKDGTEEVFLRSGKTFKTKTDTGRVQVPDNAPGGACEVTTDTGDIKLEIQG